LNDKKRAGAKKNQLRDVNGVGQGFAVQVSVCIKMGGLHNKIGTGLGEKGGVPWGARHPGGGGRRLRRWGGGDGGGHCQRAAADLGGGGVSGHQRLGEVHSLARVGRETGAAVVRKPPTIMS